MDPRRRRCTEGGAGHHGKPAVVERESAAGRATPEVHLQGDRRIRRKGQKPFFPVGEEEKKKDKLLFHLSFKKRILTHPTKGSCY